TAGAVARPSAGTPRRPASALRVASAFDYSDRSGFRGPPAALRGAARETFAQPPDMRETSSVAGSVAAL
ncbi:MAG TPA: hypothetical protein VM528_08825, partial [Burkholderiaceae bacterium]|nr:hypothetical protein [Burkholderiaceae bacterium]